MYNFIKNKMANENRLQMCTELAISLACKTLIYVCHIKALVYGLYEAELGPEAPSTHS